MTRELVALGTSSQVPTRSRNHNGYFLFWDDERVLFDPGEGTQRQMALSRVEPREITRILITHFHGDHCLGLAGILRRLSLEKVAGPVHVYFPASGRVYFERALAACVYEAVTEIVPHPLKAPMVVHEDERMIIRTEKLSHGVDTIGYRLEEKRVDRRGQSFAHVMDTRACAGALALAHEVDMLVIESTYLRTETKEARERGHLTATQAAELAVQAKARRVVLTHFSQRHPSNGAFMAEAKSIHPDVITARDTRRYAVPPPTSLPL